MPYNSPPSKVSSDPVTLSNWTTHLKGNLDHIDAVLAGADSRKVPFSALDRTSANLILIDAGGTYRAFVVQHAGAGEIYIRHGSSTVGQILHTGNNGVLDIEAGANAAAGAAVLRVNKYGTGQQMWSVDTNGKMLGKGFYTSGVTAIGNNATVTFAHGLAAQPRFTAGYWSTVATPGQQTVPIRDAIAGLASYVNFTVVDGTNIGVQNFNIGATIYVIVHAIL